MRHIRPVIALMACLLAAAPLNAQTPDAAPALNTAEIAFWTSVKDSKNPAEFRAYLTAFPSGLFAQLAKLRLEELEKPQTAAPQVAPTPPPQVAPNAAAPAQFAPAAATEVAPGNIREIQLKLYDLNYDPGRIDGVMNPATRNAIREWQQTAGLTATGTMTDDHLKRLRDSKPSPTWAAVAYTARGANGWVFGRASRAQAEQEAIDLCIKRAGQKAECKPITASGSACITMANYTTKRGGTTYFGSHVALRPNQTASISEALRLCGEAQNSGNNCAARVTICADGSHKK